MKTKSDAVAKKNGGPLSAVRVMDILYEISQSPNSFSLSYLSDRLSLPKTSVFSLLKALDRGGYIEAVQGGYRLGSEAFKLGAAITQNRVFPNCVRPAFEAVAQDSGETVILGVLDDTGMEAIYVDVIESSQPLRFAVRIGDTKPLYSSTTGKIFLAHFSKNRLKDYLANIKPVQFTPRTLTNKASLLADLKSIRETGIADNIDGMVEGITSFGAPIYTNGNRLTAAIVISGPQTRMMPRVDKMKAIAQNAGREMSRLLNSPGSYPPEQIEEL